MDGESRCVASINVAFCEAFIEENRRIAAHLKAQAEVAIEELPSIEDAGRRRRIVDLSEIFGQLSIEHARLARRQEGDLGVKCHCPQFAL